MIIKISVSRQSPVQFYEAENGISLKFPLVNELGTPLTDTPLADYPKLFVEGLPSSPITLLPLPGVPGTYFCVVLANAWALAVGEVMHFWEAYIEWRGTGNKILSDAFEIAVIKAPSTSLD